MDSLTEFLEKHRYTRPHLPRYTEQMLRNAGDGEYDPNEYKFSEYVLDYSDGKVDRRGHPVGKISAIKYVSNKTGNVLMVKLLGGGKFECELISSD